MSPTNYLFVYGTLLRDANNDMSQFLLQHANYIGKGFVYGRLYQVDWYPGAILTDKKSEKVFGHIYRILEGTTLFETLDVYEGVEDGLYLRLSTRAYLDNDTECKCWMYVYNRSIANLKRIDSGNFLDLS